jgi:hypothetical protein
MHWYQLHILPQSRVLHFGCHQGELLAALNPYFGYGVDFREFIVSKAKENYPTYFFSKEFPAESQKFDYIICSPIFLAQQVDIQLFFEQLIPYYHEHTKLIVIWSAPLLSFNVRFSATTMKMFLRLSGFSLLEEGRYDKHHRYSIASLQRIIIKSYEEPSVSVIIPCRNERGTIEDAVKRCPLMGSKIELIFVDGYSTDGTLEELYRVQQLYPDKNIKILQQQGRGKGDAVRLGFSNAQEDICMILDSDLAVSPEELPKFYRALCSGAGEFINGSRLIYPMEDTATPWLNYFVNYLFAVLVSWIVGQRLTDTLCGTKVFWRHDYELIIEFRSLLGTFDPFGDFDLIFGAAWLDKKIVDVPIHYKNRVYGSSQIGGYFKNGLLLLRLCAYALYHFKWRSREGKL